MLMKQSVMLAGLSWNPDLKSTWTPTGREEGYEPWEVVRLLRRCRKVSLRRVVASYSQGYSQGLVVTEARGQSDHPHSDILPPDSCLWVGAGADWIEKHQQVPWLLYRGPTLPEEKRLSVE